MPNDNCPRCGRNCNVWFFLPEKCRICPHDKPAMPDMPEGIRDFFTGLRVVNAEQPRDI
jgi:hypothetical protein